MNTSEPERSEHTEHPRLKAAGKGLLWLLVLVLAVGPYPWW